MPGTWLSWASACSVHPDSASTIVRRGVPARGGGGQQRSRQANKQERKQCVGKQHRLCCESTPMPPITASHLAYPNPHTHLHLLPHVHKKTHAQTHTHAHAHAHTHAHQHPRPRPPGTMLARAMAVAVSLTTCSPHALARQRASPHSCAPTATCAQRPGVCVQGGCVCRDEGCARPRAC